jgi:hypothetical protein
MEIITITLSFHPILHVTDAFQYFANFSGFKLTISSFSLLSSDKYSAVQDLSYNFFIILADGYGTFTIFGNPGSQVILPVVYHEEYWKLHVNCLPCPCRESNPPIAHLYTLYTDSAILTILALPSQFTILYQ